jgi:hypothetical protein
LLNKKYPKAIPAKVTSSESRFMLLKFTMFKAMVMKSKKPIYTGIEKILLSFESNLNIFYKFVQS